MTVESPIFIQIASLRDTYEFTFRTNTEYYDFGKFEINLGYLGSSNVNTGNIRCAMYKNNEISHDFAKFSFSSLNNIGIEFREISSLKATLIGL